MKVLVIIFMVEVLILGIFVLLQLESIKDEIVTAVKDKGWMNAVYGKFTQSLSKNADAIASEGRVPDLSAMANAKLKAQTLSAQDPEQR